MRAAGEEREIDRKRRVVDEEGEIKRASLKLYAR